MSLISRQLFAGGKREEEGARRKGSSGEDRGEGTPGSRGQFPGPWLSGQGSGCWASISRVEFSTPKSSHKKLRIKSHNKV
jgi:hypothetical protein